MTTVFMNGRDGRDSWAPADGFTARRQGSEVVLVDSESRVVIRLSMDEAITLTRDLVAVTAPEPRTETIIEVDDLDIRSTSCASTAS